VLKAQQHLRDRGPGGRQARLGRGEIDITGPLPGPASAEAQRRARRRRVLAGCGVRAAFAAGGSETEGRAGPTASIGDVRLAEVGPDALCSCRPARMRRVWPIMKADATVVGAPLRLSRRPAGRASGAASG
jgi:hypothetical protein